MNKEYSINYDDFKTSRVFNNLAGYEDYTFTVRVTNSEGLSANRSVMIKTGELGE